MGVRQIGGFCGSKGLRMRTCLGFVGLITIDGLSNVGPKILLDHREKEVVQLFKQIGFYENINLLS